MNTQELPKLVIIIRNVWGKSHLLLVGLVFFGALGAPSSGQELKGNVDPVPEFEKLRQELATMFSKDQEVRIASMQAMKKLGISFNDSAKLEDPKVKEIVERETLKMKQVDGKNRRRLKQIIDEHGWLGKSQVGEHGAMVFWIIAQHADEDVEFQMRCLKLMRAAPAGEVERKHVAYLTDRVLINENKPQRYGTQMNNNFQPRPLEDPDNVDQRRAEVGLPSLSEYLRVAKQQYEKMAAGEAKSGEASK